jgi:hypothetical protein
LINGVTKEASVLPPSREDLLATLERVIASPQFRGASRLQEFLRHIVDRTLEGDLDALRETRLGIDVFARGDRFDPGSDSIVRTQATLLRKRLAGYYADSGTHDRIRIDLPRGGYVAQFTPVEELAVAPSPPAPIPSIQSDRRPHALLLIAIGALAGIAGATLATRLNTPSPRDHSQLPIWSSFLQKFERTTIALGTPYFLNLGDGMYFRDVRVNEHAEHSLSDQFQRFLLLAPTAKAGPSVYTGVGEALGLARLTQMYERNGWPMRTVRADQLRWQDLKDENVIILGSFRFKSIESAFDPFSHFAFDGNSSDGYIRNLHPRPGEASEYRSSADKDRGTTYALATLLPGKTPGRRILLLHGLHTWGTEAAAEFVSSDHHLQALRQRVIAVTGRQEMPEFIQVLLRADLRNDQPLGIHVETFRELTAK